MAALSSSGTPNYRLVFTRLQSSLEELFDSDASKFLQPSRLRLGPRSIHHVLESSAPPQTERFAEQSCRLVLFALCQR